MYKIIPIFILLLFSLYSIFAKTEQEDQQYKRTVIIYPFINTNEIKEFDYLSKVISYSLYAELQKNDHFNFVTKETVDKEFKQLELTANQSFDYQTARSLARKHKADVFVIGRYVINNDKILILIDAYDYFNEENVSSMKTDGNIGFDLVFLIESISAKMAKRMNEDFKKVDQTYFDNMVKIIKKEKKEHLQKMLTPKVKAGMSLTVIGSSSFLIGIPLFITAFSFYAPQISDYVLTNNASNIPYTEYMTNYYTFQGLFYSGMILLALGFVLDCVGIPLLAINLNKQKNLNFEVSINQEITLSFNYTFY